MNPVATTCNCPLGVIFRIFDVPGTIGNVFRFPTWSLLKRSLKGTYVSVEPFHLFRYLDEQAWRYNHRATKDVKVTDGDRTALSQIVGKRLTFAEVTGKVGERAA